MARTPRPIDQTPREIDRRDFIGSSLLGSGAMLLTAAAPVGAALKLRPSTTAPNLPASMTGLGPAWTGPGGIGDYAQSNGNTADVVNRAHSLIRNGDLGDKLASAKDVDDLYDVVIVGAGIAGLVAAYSYRKQRPDAKLIVIDMNDMFGGEARANEFEVDGYRLSGPQGSNAVGVQRPDGGPMIPFHALYHELDLPDRYHFSQPKNLSQEILFPTDNWLPMTINYKAADVGFFFDGHGWVKNPWSNAFAGAPLSDRLKLELMKLATNWRVPYTEDWKRYLDGMTLREWLINVVGVSDEAVDFAYAPVIATGGGGLGPDAVSAYFHADARYVHHDWLRLGHDQFVGMENTFWLGVELPGGNGTIARRLVQKLLPDAYPKAAKFRDFLRARIDKHALDQEHQITRMRLNSTVISIAHDGPPESASQVNIVYSREGHLERV